MKLAKEDDDFFDYTAKYEDDSKIKETRPQIEDELEKNLKEASIQIWELFDCKWFSRIDFLVKNWKIYFLEVNTIPGMTEASILPKAWKETWRNFEELISLITKN